MDLTNYPFIVDPTCSSAIAPSLTQHMTLRRACRDYADAGGVAWDNVSVAELSCTGTGEKPDGQITCLNKVTAIVGLPCDDKCISYDLVELQDIITVIDVVTEQLTSTISSGTPWCIRRTVLYNKIGTRWKSQTGYVDTNHGNILDKVQSCGFRPLTVSTVHAAVEASKYGSSCEYDKLYLYPHKATRSNGLLGTLADNEALDMAPSEESNVPDIELREYNDEYVGFVCSGHTSHSTEAGRMRRVTADTRVRIISQETLMSLTSLRTSLLQDESGTNIGARTWTVFFMGKYCSATWNEVKCVLLNNTIQSSAGICMYSTYVNMHMKMLVFNCSSGTLLKLCSNKIWADNTEVYKSHKPPGFKPLHIDTIGTDSVRTCFSAYFGLWQYIKSNRPPRPLIGSVQTPQAHCLPWCPGTAAVSPCYTFSPLMTTELYAGVMKDQKDGTANVATYLPGENVGVLYLNVEHNYEDAILVSQRYIDNGGFCSVSLVPYLISQSEYVPPVGSTLCSIQSPWWKAPCPSWCTHTRPTGSERKIVSSSPKTPSGTVRKIEHTLQGDVSVEVFSFQCLQQGDKLSTPHGQKGIVVKDILTLEDLPVVTSSNGYQVFPDVVVAMSSIVTRQTNGQLYEAAKSMQLLASSARIPCIVSPNETCDVSEEFTVLDGRTGKPYVTHFRNDDGTISKHITAASFGYTRMFAQTQMSRERAHVSHSSPTARTLRTTTGRSRGGGVAWGEMDIQASVAAGLIHCNAEITSRGSMIVFPVCVQCKRLGPSCLRNDGCRHVGTAIPYDQVVFAIVTRIVYGYDILYDVEIQS